ncbi:hypothetical protein TNCV_3804031 [Trichonephila clavipes]|nr:hypothetical protein TNCV_3804031 [Trichonephila clavipes]
MSKKRTTAVQGTAELNLHLNSAVQTITVKRPLHKQNICGRAIFPLSQTLMPNAIHRGVTVATKPGRLINERK